ncbi:MAG: exonuclease domain-containing protein [Myxococcales bacterium]|nr:exonuclease domain-containing protein [Myxococcales bacterium]
MSGQEAQNLVVVDIEATCWRAEDDPALAAVQRNECEIIEIGAVRLAPTVAPFRAVVRPRRHPTLSAFCTELTGLQQPEVDAGQPFPAALEAFLSWCGGDEQLVLASWGAFDHAQLLRDAGRYRRPAPRWTHLNIKRRFSAVARARGARRGGWMSLRAALRWLDLDFVGRQHSSVDDARNAARVLDWVLRNQDG